VPPPFSAFPSPYTASYAVGAVRTDSGIIGGIGGCAAQNLEQEFRAGSRSTRS
jgi:para-nitrobenzyl esterase